MAGGAAQSYSDVILLRGGHLSCHFLREAPRTCYSAFNDKNKNNCEGKMFWLTLQAAGLSGIKIPGFTFLNPGKIFYLFSWVFQKYCFYFKKLLHMINNKRFHPCSIHSFCFIRTFL